MIVSFIFLRIRYKVLHYVGVVVCISGAVCLLFTDGGDSSKDSNGTIPIYFYIFFSGHGLFYTPY